MSPTTEGVLGPSQWPQPHWASVPIYESRGWTIHSACKLGNGMLYWACSVVFKRFESVANFYESHRNLHFWFLLEKSDLATEVPHFHVAAVSWG